MGCCWSEERDSEEAYSRSDSNSWANSSGGNSCSTRDSWSNGGSDADVWDQERQPLHQQWNQSGSNSWKQGGRLPKHILRAPSQCIDEEEEGEEGEEDGLFRTAHHNEERRFFQLFFEVMEHVPGYQGILRRWEKEDQRAEVESAGRCQMGRVWPAKCGYVESLQRVKSHVTNKRFKRADRARLSEWAQKVVQRRSKEYNAAQAKGKADSKHLKVLQEWRGVKTALQALL